MWSGKRIFDLVFALSGLVVLSPFFIIIGLLIKVTSKGPIFYRQVRVGLNGREFRIHKFRTMYLDADQRGLALTVGKDPRITSIGHFVRKFKLDEFAQLIDVVQGSMSIVGPRPEVPKYVSLYPTETKVKILAVRPGITDPASVYFKNESEILESSSDPEKTYIDEILPRKLQYSLEYVENASFQRDIQLILLTLKAVFF